MHFYGKEYGDVIFQDTRFGTNKFKRPLAIRCIMDCDMRVKIIGIALARNETSESFKWFH
jgi:hypothetical protein